MPPDPKKLVFPGVTHYFPDVAAAIPGATELRHRVLEDPLLHEIGDIIGQAYAAPPFARAGILAAAEDRSIAAAARYALIDFIIAKAKADLLPEAPKGRKGK